MRVRHDARVRVVIKCGLPGHHRPCSDDVMEVRLLDAHLAVAAVTHGKVSGMDSGVRVRSRVTLVDPTRDVLQDGQTCPCAECEPTRTVACSLHGLPVVDEACGEVRCRACLDEYEADHKNDRPPRTPAPVAVFDQHHGYYAFEKG